MAKKTRMEVLQETAARGGFIVRTYSPGDGVTRYRFFREDDLKAQAAHMEREYNPGEQSYFGPWNGCYTAMGYKEALTFATGGACR